MQFQCLLELSLAHPTDAGRPCRMWCCMSFRHAARLFKNLIVYVKIPK